MSDKQSANTDSTTTAVLAGFKAKYSLGKKKIYSQTCYCCCEPKGSESAPEEGGTLNLRQQESIADLKLVVLNHDCEYREENEVVSRGHCTVP